MTKKKRPILTLTAFAAIIYLIALLAPAGAEDPLPQDPVPDPGQDEEQDTEPPAEDAGQNEEGLPLFTPNNKDEVVSNMLSELTKAIPEWVGNEMCKSGESKGSMDGCGDVEDQNTRHNGIVVPLCGLAFGDVPSSVQGNQQWKEWCWASGDFLARHGKQEKSFFEKPDRSAYFGTADVGDSFSKAFVIMDENNGWRDAQQRTAWKDALVTVSDFVSSESANFDVNRCTTFGNQCAHLVTFMYRMRFIEDKDQYRNYYDRLMEKLDGIEADGVWGERDTRTRKVGFDGYQAVSIGALAVLEDMQDGEGFLGFSDSPSSLKDNMKQSCEFMGYWAIDGKMPKSPTARKEWGAAWHSFPQSGLWSILYMDECEEAARYGQSTRAYWLDKNIPRNGYEWDNLGFYDNSVYPYLIVKALLNNKQLTVARALAWEDDEDYLKVFEGAKLVTVKAGDQQFFFSYGNTYPSGGVLATYVKGNSVCYDNSDPVGSTCSVDTSFGNEHDVNAKLTVVSDEIPYRFRFDTNKGSITYVIDQSGFEVIR